MIRASSRNTIVPWIMSLSILFAARAACASVVPTPEERARQGMLDFSEGRYLDAERSWLLALRSRPGYLKAKAELLERTGRLEQALELANRLRALEPSSPEAAELAGRLYVRLGQVDKGRALLELAIQRGAPVSARTWLAEACLDAGDVDRARKLLALPGPGDSARWHALQGRLALRDGDKDRALKELLQATALDPSSPGLLYHLARARMAAGRPAAARKTAEHALELMPGDPALRLLLVRTRLLEDGDGGRGDRVFMDELRELSKSSCRRVAERARLLLIDLLEKNEAIEEALKLCLRDGEKALPRKVLLKASKLYMKLAAQRERRGARQKADLAFSRSIDLLQKALADDPNQQAIKVLLTERYIELGRHYFENGKKAASARLRQQLFSYAIFNLERASELNPKVENKAHHILGRILTYINRHEEALEHFSKIKNELSNFVESIFSYGESCLELRKFLDASLAFSRVIRIKPDHWKANRDLGLTYWRLKAYDKAERFLKKAINLYAGDPTAWYFMGKLRYRQRKYGAARTCLGKVLELTRKTKDGRLQSFHLDAKRMLEELPTVQKADRELEKLGGTPMEEELNRRLYGGN